MEIEASVYYNKNKFTNTSYLLMMFLEEYFGKEIFKGDGSRVIYASNEFAFRQRLNRLYPEMTPPYTSISSSQMQFPFCSYYRSSNWIKDTRLGIQSANAILSGISLSEEIPITARFIPAEATFDMYFFFDRDDDAQNCYDILMWIQNPAPKQFGYSGLQYKSYKIDMPIVMSVTELNWTNTYKENEWLKKNRVITIKASVTLKSMIMDQYAQGSTSSLFEVQPSSNIPQFYITRESILDFLSFKNDPLLNTENIVLDVLANFEPDPQLEATFLVDEATTNSVTFDWNYNIEAVDLFNDTVSIILSNGTTYLAPIDDKSITITGLDNESTYTASIYFTSTTGQVVKLTQTFTTSNPEDKKELRGMVGLTW